MNSREVTITDELYNCFNELESEDRTEIIDYIIRRKVFDLARPLSNELSRSALNAILDSMTGK